MSLRLHFRITITCLKLLFQSWLHKVTFNKPISRMDKSSLLIHMDILYHTAQNAFKMAYKGILTYTLAEIEFHPCIINLLVYQML